MGNKFFVSLSQRGLLVDWAPLLDWYLSSEHFEGEIWKNYISVFTRKIKKINCIQGANIKYGTKGTLTFPARRPNGVRIILEQTTENCESIGKDFVRHIRNGIAHGRARFTKIGDEDYIEIKDYGDNLQTRQTAYILIPCDCLKSVYDVYSEQDKIIRQRK